jgi:hypothetical protein
MIFVISPFCYFGEGFMLFREQVASVTDSNAPTLCDKFSPNVPAQQFDALVESLAWYVKIPWVGPGVDKDHVHALFTVLPELMKELRHSVKTAYDGDPELQNRLPVDDVKAYQSIN